MKLIIIKFQEENIIIKQRQRKPYSVLAPFTTYLRVLRLNKLQLLFAVSFLSISLLAQDNTSYLKFDLSVRYRFELWNGMNAKNYGDDSPEAIGSLNDKILVQKIIPGGK